MRLPLTAVLFVWCGSTLADDVPLGFASVMRDNGTVLTGQLLKVNRGAVTIAGPFKPIPLGKGETIAIQFEQFVEEPSVMGSVRLKYFYNPETQEFDQQETLVKVGPWSLQQDSSFEQVSDTDYYKDGDGQIVSSKTVHKNVERFASQATASATLSNKSKHRISVRLELRVFSSEGESWLNRVEYKLDPGESTTATESIPTGNRKISRVTVYDVYNKRADD
jgi:hypothetical protein